MEIGQNMNDFTEEELRFIYSDMTMCAVKATPLCETQIHLDLRNKIMTMINNYSEKNLYQQNLYQWIEERMSEIALKLPTEVHKDPASFACGYNSGYKNAILELERFLETENEK